MEELYWQSLIQGIVQGVTEFLPVSSTGHMIIVDEFLKMKEEFAEMFEIVIQLGSILSVVVYFRNRIFPFGRNDDGKLTFRMPGGGLYWKTLTALVPALVIGGLFASKITTYLYNSITVAIALIVGGIVLIVADRAESKLERSTDMASLSYRQAFGIGCIQCLAMIPGTSRSASTIVGGMFLGCSRTLAAEFSFYLAIPTMCAASAYSLLKHAHAMTSTQWIALGIGFTTAFFVAWGVIALFMAYIRKHDFRVFGYYRILLGAVVLAFKFIF